MALTLTAEQEAQKAKFTAFFSEANTGTIGGSKIDKATLTFFIEMNGVMFAKADIIGGMPQSKMIPNIPNIFKPKTAQTPPKSAVAEVQSCVWNMNGVCVGNNKMNLVNVLPKT